MVDWAQYYASLGWPVFPCRGKAPLTEHGFRDATTDPFQIATWWEQQFPGANIGIPCGQDFWALDVDPRLGGDNSLFQLERQHGLLPHTLLSHTGGGGNHYLWKLPDGRVVINKAKIGDGLDVQGSGSYIIVPPSIHPETGTAYCWDLMDGPDDIMPQDAPEWLLALVTTVQTTTPSATQSATSPSPLPPVNAPILQGKRNDTLYTYGTGFARAGASYEMILAALTEANKRCHPPLDGAEVARTARSASASRRAMLLVSPPGVPASSNGTGPSQGASQWGTLPASAYTPMTFTDAAEIWDKPYNPPQWLVDGLIPEGLTYLVGSQKSGKTYLSYSLALTLATSLVTHQRWLDFYALEMDGPVVFLALEDTEQQFWYRIHQLMPFLQTFPKDRLFFRYDPSAPSLGEGLADHLYHDIVKVYQPALLVIDPISYVSGVSQNKKYTLDMFTEFRRAMLPVRAMAAEEHFALLGSEHRRKQSADDVDIFETQQGTNAKGAIADATLVIVRERDDITLRARLRNGGEQTITITFSFDERQRATLAYKGAHDGNLDPRNHSELTMKAREILAAMKVPMSVAELLAATGIPDSRQARQAMFQVMYRACREGVAQRTNRGMYVWTGGN